MRRFLGLFLFGVFSCAIPNAMEVASAAQESVTVAEISKAWLAREQEVKSFSADWKERHTFVRGSLVNEYTPKKRNPKNIIAPAEDYTYSRACSLKVTGQNVRCEYEWHVLDMEGGHFKPTVMIDVFDGTTNTLFVGREDKASTSSITRGAYPVGLAKPETRAIALALRPSVLPGSLFEPERLVLIALRPVLNDVQCLMLEDQRAGSSYWVDPTKNFSIVRLADKTHTLDIDWLKQDGLWLPKSWHSSILDLDGSVLEDTVAFDITYRLNDPASGADFELKYPPKTFIVDTANRTGKGAAVSVIRSDGTKRTVSRDEIGKTTFSEWIAPERSLTAYVTWVSGAIVLMAALVCMVVFRKRIFSFKGEKQ